VGKSKERFIVDEHGNQVGVLLEIAEYRRLLEELEELASIKAYDRAKASQDEVIPLEQEDLTYDDLHNFIAHNMVMRAIYQPVMLLALLLTKGECLEEVIAWAILAHLPENQGQIEYYRGRVRNMVGPVLQRHNIVSRQGKTYRLNGFKSLTEDQVSQLVTLCRKKINEYQAP